ncbi:Crp/Fnr family transcriptional regulator [Oceanospirillum sp.]|uniref:Crp/Fnr family transcriptional regulator n=1 Tax=Oceanospirillum sp. TaxID=2021254 RepID=UPI003A8F43AB
MAVSIEVLRRFDLLHELTDPALESLAAHAVLRKFSRREIVIDPGEAESNLCFLFEGSLQGVDFTVDGREVGLYFVRPGDFCGEVGLFGHHPNPEFVVALAKSQVVLLPYSAIESVMYEIHPLIKALSQRLARRVIELTQQRSVLSLTSIPLRIYRQLAQLSGLDLMDSSPAADGHGKTPDLAQEINIANPPTHQEMAIMLNTSRETVTRVFQSLQAEDIVQRNGTSSLIIKQPEKLYYLAHGEA